MVRCGFCKKKTGVPITCKACSLELCTRCIDLSIHECKKIENAVNEKKKILEDNLMKNKINNKKIDNI